MHIHAHTCAHTHTHAKTSKAVLIESALPKDKIRALYAFADWPNVFQAPNTLERVKDHVRPSLSFNVSCSVI